MSGFKSGSRKASVRTQSSSSQQSRAKQVRGRRIQGRQKQDRQRELKSPAIHGRGWQLPTKKARSSEGYTLERHSINFSGTKGVLRALDPRLVAGIAALIVLALIGLIILIVLS